MPDPINLNINGKQVNVTSGTQINQRPKEEQAVLKNIFDDNRDGVINEAEMESMQNLMKGVYKVDISQDSTRINYTEDLNSDGTPEYVSDWTFDNEGIMTERTRDKDGDGTIDYRSTEEQDENGRTISTTDIFSDGSLTNRLIQKFDKNDALKVIERIEETYENGELISKMSGVQRGDRFIATREEYKDGKLSTVEKMVTFEDKDLTFSKKVNYEEKDKRGKPTVELGLPNGTSIKECLDALEEES